MRFLLTLCAAAALVSCTSGLTSPNGKLVMAIEGQEMTVRYEGTAVLSPVHIGLVTEGADLDSALVLKKVSGKSKVNDDYIMLTGKRSHCVNEANERTYTFVSPEGGVLGVQVRLYDDGLAFRYIVEDGMTVVDDCTSYCIPDGVNRWMAVLKTDYEQAFPKASDGAPSTARMWPRPEPGRWAYPALVEPAEGVFALITEADLRRGDSASSLDNHSDSGKGWSERYKVKLTGPAAFSGGRGPWRTIILGSLSDIVESTLVTDLSTPSQIDDAGWIRPGVSSWVYWYHNHGSKDFAIDREYIDLAADMGWPYCLVDWEWPEMADGFDIGDVMSYAADKGVKINLWYNSGTSWIGPGAPQPQDRLNTAESREREMAWLESIGVTGIKVDFFLPDDAGMTGYYLDILSDAARHHLLVDFHGCTIPRGWQRTWPNLMSMESVYGAEWYNNGPMMTDLAAGHNATLPFTRNVIGPMDYTPGTFSDSQFPHITTDAHELALPILFESGLQHMPDQPSAYAGLPEEARAMYSSLPSAWDDTKLLAGYPGESVVIARRKGDVWYIAGVNGTSEEKTLSFSLERLGADAAASTATVFCDGAEDREIVVREMAASAGGLAVNCRARGGFAALLHP